MIILFSIILMCPFVHAQPEPLQITAELQSQSSHFREYDLSVKVVNVSSENQNLGPERCGYHLEHWKTNHPLIVVMGAACLENLPPEKDYVLPPQAEYKAQLRIAIDHELQSQDVTFRMGLQPAGSADIVWSNLITVSLSHQTSTTTA